MPPMPKPKRNRKLIRKSFENNNRGGLVPPNPNSGTVSRKRMRSPVCDQLQVSSPPSSSAEAVAPVQNPNPLSMPVGPVSPLGGADADGGQNPTLPAVPEPEPKAEVPTPVPVDASGKDDEAVAGEVPAALRSPLQAVAAEPKTSPSSSLESGEARLPVSIVEKEAALPDPAHQSKKPRLSPSLSRFPGVWYGEEKPTNPGIPATPEKLYHYTTEHGAMGILRDAFFRMNEQSVLRYGIGVYFTALPPESRTEDIVYNNFIYNGFSKVLKTEYCFEFLSKNIPMLEYVKDQSWHYSFVKGRKDRDVWKTPLDRFHLHETTGTYYRREISGDGPPASVTKYTWDFSKRRLNRELTQQFLYY
jgi:hypothetical protein